MPGFPPMRYVDAVPVDHEGERMVCISDPSGYVEEQLLLSGPAFFIAVNLDGKNDAAAIQRVFTQQFPGARVGAEQIQQIAVYLDEHGFLLSPRFAEIRRQCIERFRALPRRPAYCAGRVYPEDAAELTAYIESILGGGLSRDDTDGLAPLRCLIVPHIDYARGAPGYAAAYREMHAFGEPDTVIIFGVAHAGASVPFVLTRKAFETPLGVLETDGDVLDRLEQACSWDPYADELVHRTEHSVEFQAVMLAHLFGARVRIVPVLCASLCGEAGHEAPADVPGVQRFLAVCAELAQEPGRRISVIAGADLAHVGKRFGDDFDITAPIVEAVEQRDREDLARVAVCEAEGFYRSVMRDENERRVCGLNCIYAALKTVEGTVTKGEMLHYGYAPDPAGGMVSFASMALQ